MYIIANTRIEILVLVDFQDDYYRVNYWIIYVRVQDGGL